MAAEQSRRSVSSAKMSKKGGRRGKLTAEEEAKRREQVKEQLMQQLELERRALKVVERLLEDSVAEDFLVDCAKFITTANYKDTVEERSILKCCGYPICSNKLGKIPTQQFRICTKTNRVFDITERKMFCSNFCYKSSKEFELQISQTPLWLRTHESPPGIKLLKKGDGGRSGEEVMLSARRLAEGEIENPLASSSEGLNNDGQSSAGAGHSDGSDGEQDFVSSVVSQQQKPRVHWGDLPKRTDEDGEGKHEEVKMRQNLLMKGNGDETELHRSQTKEKKEIRKEKVSKEPFVGKELHRLNTDEAAQGERDSPEDISVEEVTAKINTCLSEIFTQSPDQPEPTSPLTSPAVETKPSLESEHPPPSTLTVASQDQHRKPSSDPPGLNITQVGMSRTGAAGLRDLLKNLAAPDAMRLNLLEGLKATLKEWRTDETVTFLYGIDPPAASAAADVKEETEELDEDDLEDDVTSTGAEEQQTPSAAAPDYETLQKATQQMELKVREFYKGTWVLPDQEGPLNGNEATAQDKSTKDPVLPLVDSQAQQLIQKKITVEKLSGCLRNIVGPLCLTMSDVSTHLNNLVRTFRFTNKNIIHKSPEWTLIAVVLLHLLAEVSPVVREALKMADSVEYLNTLMGELGLQEQDLLNVVQLFKVPKH
ncbi:putative RNA polymerase II subunit B1 CTD phosphatase rpap2 [Cololabis saira]|uniref:putative RNA polymerase II subunit B1 CTD phosphatase rpap2 n=1 Tax=Cololabis saira TaxID=129043 RepID=UPI002AD4187D|nr:putative RNA polymerase II subunit B1 CTD phosphatase rpap2 [Cololabis saira]